nr:helix-turn-helix transcriptional regulator [Neobittarella massiliensis]
MCHQQGISVNKLAQMSGVSQSTLDNIMNRRSFNPTIKTLVRVANAFGLTVAELLDFPALNDYSYEDDTDA